MSWRGEEGGIEAAKQKHDVIMTPGTYCYLIIRNERMKILLPLVDTPACGSSVSLLSSADCTATFSRPPGACFIPTWVDIWTFVGTFGIFLSLFLLFIRFLPMIAMSEVKIVLPEADPHYSPGELSRRRRWKGAGMRTPSGQQSLRNGRGVSERVGAL